VLAQQALPQDESILRADRDDQAEARQEACYANRKAHAPCEIPSVAAAPAGTIGGSASSADMNSIDTFAAAM
jgi:hypothetical protein